MRRAIASRASFLVDGERYFAALRSALRGAREQILVAGWDLHTDTELTPDDDAGPSRLTDVLTEAFEAAPGLRAHFLVWKAPWPYRFSRQWFKRRRLQRRFGARVDYREKPGNAFGSSHHEKIVVVDDRLAFVGGIDLTARRWDRSPHPVELELRLDPWGDDYEAWHDIQLVVEGDAARALGEHVRRRWHDATGDRLAACAPGSSAWPDALSADLTGVPVRIARTDAAANETAPIREIETLYEEAIRDARRWIYLENQYFACENVVRWLEARLGEADGPEVVLVSPAKSDDWLDDAVMGSKRAVLLARLQGHRNAHRLRVYEPVLRHEGTVPLFVHAKLLATDRGHVQVGSANLANRSFRLDTECDVAVACGEARQRFGVPLVFRLLGEHLDAEAAQVEGAFRAKGSLIDAIEGLRGRDRTLRPYDASASDATLDRELAASLDPENPLRPRKVLWSLLHSRPGLRRRLVGAALLLAGAVLGLVGALLWAAGRLC